MAESKNIKTIAKSQVAKHLPDAEAIPGKRHLTELNSMLKDYVKNMQDVHNDECTLSRELSTLKDQIHQIGIQVDNLDLTEFELQSKLQEVTRYQKEEEYLKQLQSFFELLGYSITIIKSDDENKERLYLIKYSNNCSIVLKHTQDHTFELMEIKPDHLNFMALKTLLETSQDVQGFLFNISQYFNTIGTSGNQEE